MLQCIHIRTLLLSVYCNAQSFVGYITLGAFVAGCRLIKQLQGSLAGQGKDNDSIESLANCRVGLAHNAVQKLERLQRVYKALASKQV